MFLGCYELWMLRFWMERILDATVLDALIVSRRFVFWCGCLGRIGTIFLLISHICILIVRIFILYMILSMGHLFWHGEDKGHSWLNAVISNRAEIRTANFRLQYLSTLILHIMPQDHT